MEEISANKYREYLLRENKLLCEMSHRKSFDAGWNAALEAMDEQNLKLRITGQGMPAS